jgi:heparinase II/III-like protein/uncharacterized protein DUF4962
MEKERNALGAPSVPPCLCGERRSPEWNASLFAWLAALTICFSAPGAGAAGGEPGNAPADGGSKGALATLKAGHPRLILSAEDLARLRELIERDEGARKVRDALRRSGEKLLGEAKTVEYKIVGPRLLDQSRRCLQRVYVLALLHRLDGDARYRDRALKELAAAAAFPDWNPSHFLDTAEMTHAFAIGYDWLFGALSEAERALVRGALVEKGLKPSLEFYREKKWWVAARHNWNQVCNGGMAIGALAVADEEPALAESIVSRAVESVRLPMAEYAPDGGWSEGPGYWGYATSYNVYLLAALRSALGTDFGLSELPGFSEAGLFRIHSTGPIGLTFNFADAGAGAGSAPEMFWLARRFDRPAYAFEERRQARGGDPLDLIWYDPRGSGPVAEKMPLCARFRSVEVAFLRSAWEDPQALFAGFKGGDNRANHSHLDLGTFVFDGRGVRWAHDLGADDYNMPDYFGRKRWTYYRLRSEGHNIVTLDGENQDPRARSPLIAFGEDARFSFAVADLAAAYPKRLSAHRRGIALAGGKTLLVVDELTAEKDESLRWTLHTAKEIVIRGNQAEAAKGTERLTARILSPPGATFEVLAASGPPPEAQAAEVARLVFRASAKAGEKVRLAVALTPHPESEPPAEVPAEVKPLGEWGKITD